MSEKQHGKYWSDWPFAFRSWKGTSAPTANTLDDLFQESALPVYFNDICFSVGEKEILRHVHGGAESGRMLALMGPTGSGKTTLLHILGNRVRQTAGTISYGQYRWCKALKRHIAFVEQDDIVSPKLTVRETLSFASQLRLSGRMTTQQKNARVEEVLVALKLERCADTRVGNQSQRGISGGERKRMCIASEFLSQPKILLLDEPTSGLDSTMARLVVECMQSIAKQKTVVVSSIHQPSIDVFHRFDDLMLLNDGQVTYYGPTASCAEPFLQMGFICPQNCSPIDFLMDLMTFNILNKSQKAILVNKYREPVSQPQSLRILRLKRSQRYQTPWIQQAYVLFQRAFLIRRRESFAKQTAMLFTGNSLLTGLLWINLELRENDIFSKRSLGLWIPGVWMLFSLFGGAHFFKPVWLSLRKDLYSNTYHLSAYFLAATLAALSMMYFWFTFWFVIVYSMSLATIGSIQQFFAIYATMILHIATMHLLGQVISASIPERDITTVTILVDVFFFVYSGLFFPISQVPTWLSWAYWVNVFRYVYWLMLTFLFTMPNDGYLCDTGTKSNYASCTNNTGTATNETYIEPDMILEELNVYSDPWIPFTVLLTCCIAFALVAYQCLRRSLRDAMN